MPTIPSDASLRRAQTLRLRRSLWGCATYLCTSLCVLAYYAEGLVPRDPVIDYLVVVTVINVAFLTTIASGLNLRFAEPSLTGPQIIAALWPSIYIMYYLNDPQARSAILLFAMVGMLLGTLAFDFRRLVAIGGIMLFSYLVMLAALLRWAPERVDLRTETVLVFTYGVVLLMISYLGSEFANLRNKLRARNRLLEVAVEELRKLATLDPLTRLPNRRSLMNQLIQEQSRLERRRPGQASLCLLLLDIDYFKQINDSWGHQAGDEVLQAIAEALQQSLRQGDFIGRFGGEEFLMIQPETTTEGALTAAERMRAAVYETPLPALPADKRITVSVGLAVHDLAESIQTTLERADAALYEAKRQGRNCVVIAPPRDGSASANCAD